MCKLAEGLFYIDTACQLLDETSTLTSNRSSPASGPVNLRHIDGCTCCNLRGKPALADVPKRTTPAEAPVLPARSLFALCLLLTFGLLYHVTPSHGGIPVVVVLLPGDEIDLPEQFLLMVFQLAGHRNCGTDSSSLALDMSAR